jgi:hypothetical protein
MGEEQGSATHASGGEGGFSARMATAHHDYVEFSRIQHAGQL